MGEHQHRPPILPRPVQNVIKTPLWEDDTVGLFISNLADYINSAYVPSTEFIQILLYLSLAPPPEPLKPEPMYLLHRILACHSPTNFADSIPTPLRGSNAAWSSWHGDTAHALGKGTVKMMSRCREGVWDLLWRSTDDEARTVGDDAWVVLGWLVDVWEKDQLEYASSHPDDGLYSPMFVSQLAAPSTDLIPDNPSPILDITRSAFGLSNGKMGRHQRIDLAARLFSLLFNSSLHKPPTFHPPSLTLSFLTLIRSTLAPEDISTFLTYLHQRIPRRPLACVYAISIEDLGGLRVSRAAARKTARANGAPMSEFEHTKPFPLPTLPFLLSDLLLVQPNNGRESRMEIIKLALVGIMIPLHPADEWARKITEMGPDWMNNVKSSLLDHPNSANTTTLIALLQTLSAAPPTHSPPPLPTSPPLSQRISSMPAPPAFSTPTLPTSPPRSQQLS